MKIVKSAKKKSKFLTANFYTYFKTSINKIGNKHKCYVCGATFNHFMPYRKGSVSIPPFVKELKLIGSDVDNHKCIFCTSHDRERHLYMFFDILNIWQDFNNAVVLHISPERNLPLKIKKMNPAEYVMGDLNPKKNEIIKVDATHIDFSNNYFDFVLCNHVLEHIKDDNKAMLEIFRVLKQGGKAIIQTPFSTILQNTFEDPKINSEELRHRYYGEKDHYRVYGIDFFEKLKRVGFKLNIIKNDRYFKKNECQYYGVNYDEDLIFVQKPFNENIMSTTHT